MDNKVDKSLRYRYIRAEWYSSSGGKELMGSTQKPAEPNRMNNEL